jgi:hypothetical protein
MKHRTHSGTTTDFQAIHIAGFQAINRNTFWIVVWSCVSVATFRVGAGRIHVWQFLTLVLSGMLVTGPAQMAALMSARAAVLQSMSTEVSWVSRASSASTVWNRKRSPAKAAK